MWMNIHTAWAIWTHSTTTLLFQDAEATDIPLIYEDVTVFLATTLPKTQEYRTVRPLCMLAPANQLAGIPATKSRKECYYKKNLYIYTLKWENNNCLEHSNVSSSSASSLQYPFYFVLGLRALLGEAFLGGLHPHSEPTQLQESAITSVILSFHWYHLFIYWPVLSTNIHFSLFLGWQVRANSRLKL